MLEGGSVFVSLFTPLYVVVAPRSLSACFCALMTKCSSFGNLMRYLE